jgi:hypothetical protein
MITILHLLTYDVESFRYTKVLDEKEEEKGERESDSEEDSKNYGSPSSPEDDITFLNRRLSLAYPFSQRRYLLTHLGRVYYLDRGTYPVFANDNIVVKSSSYSQHEFMAGISCINALRSLIPNFALVLGRFYCSPPSQIGICQYDSYDKKHSYVVYERIRPSTPLYDFVETCSYEEYLNIYAQILLALMMAYERNKFCHNDLHGKNVLVKFLPHPIVIEYRVEGKSWYLKTKEIAVIIDYGHSSFSLEDDIGKRKNIFLYRTTPRCDLFHLLAATIYSRYAAQNDLGDPFYQVLKLFKFFIIDLMEPEELLRNLRKYFKRKVPLFPPGDDPEIEKKLIEFLVQEKIIVEKELKGERYRFLLNPASKFKGKVGFDLLESMSEDAKNLEDVFHWAEKWKTGQVLDKQYGELYLQQIEKESRMLFSGLRISPPRPIEFDMLVLKDLIDLIDIGKRLIAAYPPGVLSITKMIDHILEVAPDILQRYRKELLKRPSLDETTRLPTFNNSSSPIRSVFSGSSGSSGPFGRWSLKCAIF